MRGDAASAASPSFADNLQALIHSTVPHTSAALDALAFGTVILAALIAGICQLVSGRLWPPEQWMRIGFAAAPLPVYLFLPLLPWDHDLAEMFMEERLLLAFAAICGFLWTVREIRSLIKDEMAGPPKP